MFFVYINSIYVCIVNKVFIPLTLCNVLALKKEYRFIKAIRYIYEYILSKQYKDVFNNINYQHNSAVDYEV